MNESMIALLEKSNMFSSFAGGFFAEAKAVPLENFSFWLPNCFDEYTQDDGEDAPKRFNHELKSFFRKYLKTWLSQNKKSKEAIAASEDLFSVANFFESFPSEDTFIKLKPGEGIVKIHEPISNADFRFKRIGDLLAFNVYRPGRSSDEEHTTGKASVLALCRRKNANNNQGVYELIQKVEIILEIPEAHCLNSKGKVYSLKKFGSVIYKTLNPYLSTVFFPISGLIDRYRDMRGDELIGEKRGIKIIARLIHLNGIEDKNLISNEGYKFQEDARIWRQGNVSHTPDSRETDFCFREGKIALKISINSSLPKAEHSRITCSKKYTDEQFLIANVGSIMAMSLGSMMLDNHDDRFYQLNPIER